MSEQIPAPKGPIAHVLVAAVRFYQKYLSPLKMGSTCRFEPTCSAYALESVSRHGAIKGVIMSVARLSKCGPWHPGGYDPVCTHDPTSTDIKEF
ncbi:membrane protein insertion efficiency factor YidD [Corynebacterium alimapuense]|uniref:Putative membrane protein insertion efficiency factor n=1 Tax=Corynebacterium alimapuense TaxID=1576874 RepID=A0A3M8K4I1_9CORY|nr:membrane protein insertion efficiency factor YidD [Corynebacterium alimapuense]RNE48127.1 membrane protein insertion efficiency factor YidD [Corynebacterium alimapuense]